LETKRKRMDVRSWLLQAARPYVTPNRVVHDVEIALLKYPSLRPKAANFTYETGQVAVLMCIEGTIPIVFRGNQYNIPINIWLHRNYPNAPPTTYVIPTPTMIIKPSKNVDTNGRVYMPYLHHWASQPDQSNLVTLLSLLIEIFSNTPPLYSRPQGAPPLPQQQQQQQINNNGNNNPGLNQNQYANPNYGRPASPTPYGSSAASSGIGGGGILGFVPLNQIQQQQQQSHPQQSQQSNRSDSPTRLVIQPNLQSNNNNPPSAQNSPVWEDSREGGQGSIRVSLKFFGDDQTRFLYVTIHENVKNVISQVFEKTDRRESPDFYVIIMFFKDIERVLSPVECPLRIKFDSVPLHQIQTNTNNNSNNTNKNININDEPLFTIVSKDYLESKLEVERIERESLMTAVSDKLHRRIHQLKSLVSLEVDQLVTENNDLKNRQSQLLAGMEQLRNAEETIKANLVLVDEKTVEVQQTIERMGQNTVEFDPDEAITTTAPVYHQLMDLVAQEFAIEDTLYYLSKALDREKIDPQTYIKLIRNLAREQFFAKALILKIRDGLNLT